MGDNMTTTYHDVKTLAANIKQLLDTIELEASESTNQELQEDFCVKDCNGYWWYFTGERIRTLESTNDDDGYLCQSFHHGVAILKNAGYLLE